MRNLKRALSLALATVMTLGLMVVGTGAVGYTDVTSEDNQEAIEVLQAVGVMSGVTEDEFSPDGLVTRNQMAVIMCQLLDYTVSTYKGTTNFTDVASWALPYVEACYTNGIIAGYSDTQFGGEDPVTTGQAALMIMKALGYFQEPGDFGQDWLVETVRQGAQIKLFDGVDNGASEALTRNDVAQIVLNALKAECVEITSHDLVSDGNGGFTTKAVYTARTGSGVRYDAIDDERNGANNRIVNLGEDLYDGDLVLRGGDEAFGRPSVEWTYKSRSVGTYALDDNLLETYTAKVSRGTMYSLVGSTVINKLKDGESDLYVYVDGVGQQIPAAQVDSYFDRNNSTGIGSDITGNGILTEVYTNGDDDIFIVVVNTYLVKATADYNTTKEELTIETIEVDEADRLRRRARPARQSSTTRTCAWRTSRRATTCWSPCRLKDSTPSIESAELAEVVTGAVSEYTETENVFIGGDEVQATTSWWAPT